MKTLAIALGLALATLAAAPARAEHNAVSSPSAGPADETTLDFDLKIGRDGFRLGTRLFGLDGVHGAWLNGRVLPHGLSLDGRVEGDGRAHNFRMNLDLEDLVHGWMTL